MGKRNIRFYVKEYLTFSRSERNGVMVLLILLSILLIFKIIAPKIITQKSTINVNEFENEIILFEKSYDSLNMIRKNVQTKNDAPTYYSKPNAVRPTEPNFKKVEINTADTNALIKLPGIGSVLAQRIIKYRDLLKGFYSLTQLSEVYGLKTGIIKHLEIYLVVDTSKICKIDINTSEFKAINAHPYISYEQTKAIFRIRARQKIKSLIELNEKEIFSISELNRIRPYLIIN